MTINEITLFHEAWAAVPDAVWASEVAPVMPALTARIRTSPDRH